MFDTIQFKTTRITTTAGITPRPKAPPLRLVPAWRVDKVAPQVPVTAAQARAGRLRALAKAHRVKLALQPINPGFVARIATITARHRDLHEKGHTPQPR
jgi:hypothetical protein